MKQSFGTNNTRCLHSGPEFQTCRLISLYFDHPPLLSSLNSAHLPAAEDGCGCTVSDYTQITDLLNRLHSHSLCTFIGREPTAAFNQPVSCRANTFCMTGNDITATRHATNTVKTDEDRAPFTWVLTQSRRHVSLHFKKHNEAKLSGYKRAFGAETVKYVCRARRDTRLNRPKQNCFFLQPSDEWWVSAYTEAVVC